MCKRACAKQREPTKKFKIFIDVSTKNRASEKTFNLSLSLSLSLMLPLSTLPFHLTYVCTYLASVRSYIATENGERDWKKRELNITKARELRERERERLPTERS